MMGLLTVTTSKRIFKVRAHGKECVNFLTKKKFGGDFLKGRHAPLMSENNFKVGDSLFICSRFLKDKESVRLLKS